MPKLKHNPDCLTISPPQLAARWGVSVEKVHRFIESGELVGAFNVAANLRGRPRWRIPLESVQAFEQRRGATPPPPKAKRAPRRKDVLTITEYFK